MRVLLIAGSYPPDRCGVGDYTSQLARALAGQPGTEVAVLARGAPEGADTPGLTILPPVRSWLFEELPAILQRVRQWRPDMAHVQYPTQGFFGTSLPRLLPLALRLTGLRVVITWHEPPPPGGRVLLHFLQPLLGSSGLIFVRPNYLDYFGPALRRVVERLPRATIPNAANLPVSQLAPAQRAVLRERLLQGQSRLVVFFGFMARHKGVERLFEIADPATDRLVIAGASTDDDYLGELQALADAPGWRGKVDFAGFSPPDQAADLLAAADAVVLPFITGGGNWNTSIHSALAQGSFVLTTGEPASGDDPVRNLYVASPDGLSEMREALRVHAGRRVAPARGPSPWEAIAQAHLTHYARCLGRRV